MLNIKEDIVKKKLLENSPRPSFGIGFENTTGVYKNFIIRYFIE